MTASRYKRIAALFLPVTLGLVLVGPGLATGDPAPAKPKPAESSADAARKGPAPRKLPETTAEMGEIEVPPPPFSPGVFPCTDCHEKGKEIDRTRRELAEHDFKFEHDAEHRWCLDCHSAEDRDKLHLVNGDLIEFTESYKLCGQCHGDKYRDWRAGVHGRRTGYWDEGKKKYLLCVNCHSPHSPRFRPLHPEPPPVRPDHLR